MSQDCYDDSRTCPLNLYILFHKNVIEKTIIAVGYKSNSNLRVLQEYFKSVSVVTMTL